MARHFRLNERGDQPDQSLVDDDGAAVDQDPVRDSSPAGTRPGEFLYAILKDRHPDVWEMIESQIQAGKRDHLPTVAELYQYLHEDDVEVLVKSYKAYKRRQKQRRKNRKQ